MKIRNFSHKGLRRLYEDDSAKGVPAGSVDKLRDMLFALERLTTPEQLRGFPSWNLHPLTGDRKGTWSMSVTRNWRLTFSIDVREALICDVNLEDYH